MKITKILASAVITAAVGVNIAFCACANGNDADNGRESITLTADTDFKALVSEKTDNEGWKKAFSPENYYNCTLKNESSQTDEYGYLKHTEILKSKVQANGKLIYLNSFMDSSEYGKSKFEVYYAKYADNGLINYYENANSSGFTKIEFLPDGENYAGMLEAFDFYNYTAFTPDCGKFYSDFVYNEETGAYESSKTITANGIGESWDYEYDRIEVKILDGRLAYVYAECAKQPDNFKSETVFYDFDVTPVTLPADYIEGTLD